MTGRHHYSIPGASFLKTRSSSKPQAQKTVATNTNVPSPSRDTRQPSSSRAYHSQEAVPPVRPPSAAGYRTQHSNTSVNNFHVSSSARQTHVQRPTTAPPASASRTRLDVPDPRNYFSKMFSKKQTPAPVQGEEKRKSSQTLQRTSQAHTTTHLPAQPTQTPYHAGPSSTSRTAYDASPQARDSDRDDRVRQKSRDERTKEERERMRAEYAAYRAQVQEMERMATATTKMAHMDRIVSRSSRDERRQQEYESDNAKKRPQAQQMAQTAAQKQEARQSYYLNPAHAYVPVYRGAAPIRDSQQSLGPQPATRPPGVPIQSSTSSQSTSASHQVHALHAAPSVTRPEPNVTPNPLPVTPPVAELAPPPPPKSNSAPYQTTSHPLHNPLQQAQASPTMPPPYQSSGPDDKRRLEREAAGRDALFTQDRERADREREASKQRREAAEREAAASRERERELERRREAEKQHTDQELQERERELEREKRRARRAERERKKELDNAERERQKQAERERRVLEQQELEKQRETDRLRRERKDSERAERHKAERERQESERMERDRLREKAERDRERASKSTWKRRSHRDKSYSMPTNALLGATSGSDNERMASKKDSRHRSHSQSAVADPQHHAIPSNVHRPDYKKDVVHAPGLGAVYSSAPKRDAMAPSHQSIKASTLVPSQALHNDNANPRNASAVTFSTNPQEFAPTAMPEQSRTDPVFPARESIGAVPSSQPMFEGVQSKIKMATGHPISDQRQPTSSSTASPASIAHEGYHRSSLDQPSRRTSFAQPPNAAPPIGPATASTTSPQPQHGASAPSHEISTQHPILSQPRVSGDGVPGNALPASRPPQQERMLPTPQDQVSPFPDAKYMAAVQSARQSISVPKTQLTDDHSEPLRPAANVSYGAGSSSYSQTVFGSSADQSRIPGHNPQLAPMSRAPSNNSTKSRTIQPLPETLADAVLGMPVSRTASDASHTMQTGERPQSAAPQSNSQPHAGPPQGQRLSQLTPTTPIYSSTPKVLSTSRVKHESFTNFHAQPVLPTHSHSQSLPQQVLSPTYYKSSKDDVDLSAHDSLSTARARATIPASTPDATHQQYPPTQVSPSQGKTTHSLSTNLPVQPQSLSATLPPSIQDHRSSSRPTMDSNNQSLYSAPVTRPDAMSQMPSTMFSYQQSLQQSNLSMYHNHSTSRNVSAEQSQHSKPAFNSTRPLPQNNGNQASSTASKPPVTPRSASTGVYVTSTRQTGPYPEESPSSVGGGLSLDSAPVTKPSFQHPQHEPGHPTHLPTHTRPQSQVGLPSPFVHGSNQPQELMEKFGRPPQETDTLPPLTPSSSRDSHEEILMTPASLDQARTHVDVKQPPDGSQRPEKKKGGLLRLFRSSSTKSNKEKDRIEPREEDIRRQVPGSQRDQRTESLTKSRSARPPSIMRTAEAEPDPEATIIGSMAPQDKQHRASKHVPPPISIPPVESVQFRLCSSKSRRYRTMSAASMEAVDGTANNTVVGSPTSSRRSPTPSGPMTPSVRDPIEAAQAWRDNEEVFLDPGSQRRRRPGVTFDLRGDEGQKDSAVYRRVNRLHRRRRESLR